MVGTSRRLDHAGAYVAGVWLTGLALTYWLGKTGRRQVTVFCRDNKLAVGIPSLVFLGHCAEWWGPLDPFDNAGKVADWLVKRVAYRRQLPLSPKGGS